MSSFLTAGLIFNASYASDLITAKEPIKPGFFKTSFIIIGSGVVTACASHLVLKKYLPSVSSNTTSGFIISGLAGLLSGVASYSVMKNKYYNSLLEYKEGNLTKNSQDLSEKELQNQVHSTEVQQLQEANNTLQSRFDELNAEKERLNNKISEKERRINELNTENSELTDENQTLTNKISENDRRINELQSRLEELTTEKDSLSQTISEKDRSIQELQTQVQELNAEKEGLTNKISENEQMVQRLQEEKVEKERFYNQRREANEKTLNDYNKLQRQFDELTQQKSNQIQSAFSTPKKGKSPDFTNQNRISSTPQNSPKKGKK